MSTAVTGIDFVSADNNANSLSNRTSNPVTIPASGVAYSYEKWLRLYVDVAPANSVSNFKYWSSQGGSGGAGTGLTMIGQGSQGTYAQPSSTAHSGAGPLPTSSGNEWDFSTLSSTGQLTQYLVLQLAVASTASQGNMSQATVSFSYDET
jgi:hypothetical protein